MRYTPPISAQELATEAAWQKTTLMDATYLKARSTASSLRLMKGGMPIGRTKDGMNTKLDAVADARGHHPNAATQSRSSIELRPLALSLKFETILFATMNFLTSDRSRPRGAILRRDFANCEEARRERLA